MAVLPVGVLTLAADQDKVWVTRLVERLKVAISGIDIAVITLESTAEWPANSAPPYSFVVNRVSDAATPVNAKAVLAALTACSLWKIPTWNGKGSYEIGSNKVNLFCLDTPPAPKPVHFRKHHPLVGSCTPSRC